MFTTELPEKSISFAIYHNFKVGSEATNYQIKVGSMQEKYGEFENVNLFYFDGAEFTTKDRDNDTYEKGNCADSYDGGWWYKWCQRYVLNASRHNIRNSLPVTETIMAIRNV